MTFTRFALGLVVVALLLPQGMARAQDLGSTAAAMGASSALETNPMQGGAQQMNRAAAIAGSSSATPAVTPTPTQAAAISTINAVNAMAPAPATPAAPGASAPNPATPLAAANAAAIAAQAAADLHKPFGQSFFFSAEDMIQIKKAMEMQGKPNASMAPAGPQTIPPVRRIILSGLIYKAADDWLVWINGQKVTPSVSMKEIVGIKVDREVVHLQWFDIGLNGVINITMRPNQTYDIVTGVLLPGVIK